MKAILEYMPACSNTSHTAYTNEPLAAKFITESILKHFPDSFARVIDQNGLSGVKIMDNIEISAVISDAGVAERKILSLLQRHLKIKLKRKKVF